MLGAGVPQVAVFDTAFHQTLPEHAYLYAIPYQLYRRYRVRRYGFHGTSHRYVAHRWRQLTGTPREATRLVTLHLGNGCSACAISGGDSVDTSMGFTPLEGLVMGTRSGDVDPTILDYVGAKEGLSSGEAEALLNKQSGLLGISGLTHDMRELLAESREHADRRATLAIDIFCYRVAEVRRRLSGGDGRCGRAGVRGRDRRERARGARPHLRRPAVDGPDGRRGEERRAGGRAGRRVPCADGSRLGAWVIPTDEELLIARDSYRVVTGAATRF